MSLSDAAISNINAALTSTGHDPITDENDGSTEAIIAGANYEKIVKAELSRYPYSWASDYDELDLLDITPDNGWQYVYQLPANILKLASIEVNGYPIEYRRLGSKVYCNHSAGVFADWRFRADEEEFSDDFTEALITRLRGLFVAGVDEKDAEAQVYYDSAAFQFKMVRNEDAKNKTPRDRRTSRLVSVRNG